MSKKIDSLKERVSKYGEVFKTWVESLEGKKDIKSKVDVLASPEHKESMSILSDSQVRFITIANFMGDVEEWGGMFQGLKDYGASLMDVSPSKEGTGREQVIRFAGALTESKLAEKLGLSLKGEGEKGESKESE